MIVEIAKSTFQKMDGKVLTGHHFLGCVVSEREHCVQFVREKVDSWVDCVDKPKLLSRHHRQHLHL